MEKPSSDGKCCMNNPKGQDSDWNNRTSRNFKQQSANVKVTGRDLKANEMIGQTETKTKGCNGVIVRSISK